MSNEWALVIFTVLAQAVVGSFIILVLFKQHFAKSLGVEKSEALMLKPLAGLFPLVVLAMLASLAHLSSPLRAPLSIFNFGSSWLSREILCISLFALTWLLYLVFSWKEVGSPGLRNTIAWSGCTAGILTVLSMANIYMLEVQPAWNTVMTPVIFFGSVFAIGGTLAMIVLFIAAKEEANSVLYIGAVTSFGGTVVALIGVVCRYLILSGSGIATAVESAELIRSEYFGLFIVAVMALVAGLIVSVLLLAKIRKQGFSLMYTNLALTAIVLGLLLDRLVFYSAHINLGF